MKLTLVAAVLAGLASYASAACNSKQIFCDVPAALAKRACVSCMAQKGAYNYCYNTANTASCKNAASSCNGNEKWKYEQCTGDGLDTKTLTPTNAMCGAITTYKENEVKTVTIKLGAFQYCFFGVMNNIAVTRNVTINGTGFTIF